MFVRAVFFGSFFAQAKNEHSYVIGK